MLKKTFERKMRQAAMSKPVGKVLDSKAGKVGVKVGDKVIKTAKAPGALLLRKWKQNQDFRNKHNTREKYLESQQGKTL